MENMDMFIESTCSIDGSTISDFLLDSFFANSMQMSAFPMTRPYSTGTSSTDFHAGFSSGTDTNKICSTPEDHTAQSNQKRMQVRLIEVQTELEKLSEKFAQGLNTTDDIKNIFRLTETVLNIIKEIEEQPQETKAPSHNSDQSMPGVVALLLSSCYLSLIHVYQCVVGTLSQEIDGNQTAQQRTSANAEETRGVKEMSSSSLPCISIGGVKLDMPRSATVKIKIHILAQNVQHLKMSLQKCATRLSTVSPSARVLSISGAVSWDQNTNKADDSPLIDGLIGLAINDIQTREEKLLRQIRILLLDPGTKTYITK
jgi:hypothetical protein